MTRDPEEPEEDTVQPMNKAQRLAVACVVAPTLRALSARAALRRVAKVDKNDKVVGYTTLAEVQKALLLARSIELETQEGVRPKQVICRNCGKCIPVGRGHLPRVCRDGCDRSCDTSGCEQEISLKRARYRAIDGVKVACKTCMGRKLTSALSQEERSERGRRAGALVTREQNVERALKVHAARTPAERSEIARRANAARTAAERSESARKSNSARTPEQRANQAARFAATNAARSRTQRAEAARKSWNTRRANAAAKEGA